MNIRPKLQTLTVAVLALICVSSNLPAGGASAVDVNAEKMARTVTIYRDTYGVPHIYAPTDAACVFGLMYAQAEDNFWQLEEDYIRALSRAAEIHGERMLMSDVMRRAFEINQLAMAEYAQAGARTRQLCDAFAAGLNYFLATHPKIKPRLITRFEPWHILAAQRSVPSLNNLGVRQAEVFEEMRRARRIRSGR